MGCASSKQIEVAVDVYRPPPSSFAVFDIQNIQEPWLMADDAEEQDEEKPAHVHVPTQILDKLNKIESDGSHSWDEVSKVLEDLKPTLNNPPPNPQPVTSPGQDSPVPEKQGLKVPLKNFSIHTLDELHTKLSSKPTELKKTESMPTEGKKNERVKSEMKKSHSFKPESRVVSVPVVDSGGIKPVKQNIFLLKDRQEREREGKGPPVKWDPLSDYPEKCPPGGSNSVVLYTTSLGGVRRTYEDCNRVRSILELRQVVFDERDVSLHGQFLNELKELVGGGG